MRNYLAIGGLLALYALVAADNIYGMWDSLVMWNGRARLLVYHDPLWLFQTLPDTHNDYPPLLYLIVSTGYRLAGDTPLVPIVLHGAILAGVLWCFRRSLPALLLVGVVCVEFAAHQSGDLPLALTFLLATVAYHRGREDLAGAALGLGVLLKNEGIVIDLVFMTVWIARERRIPRAALLQLAPFVLALWVFRQFMRAPSDLFTDGALARLTDVGRYTVIIPAMLVGVVSFGTGAMPVFGLLAVFNRRRVTISVPLLAAGGVLAAYGVIFAITPHPLQWHLQSSLDRLLLHLFPVVVYSVLRGKEV